MSGADDTRFEDASGAGTAADCAAVRDALAAEPHARPAALVAHLDGCAACTRYAAEMRVLEAQLQRAFAVRVPPAPPLDLDSPVDVAAAGAPGAAAVVTPLAARRPADATRPRSALLRGLALAASVAGVALLVTLLWTGAPRESLAGALVEHMAEEPGAWQRNPAVPASALAYVLGRSGVRLEPGAPEVTYAHSCFFRGNYVPHLAVRTPSGVVTVLVLPDEDARGRIEFDEGGYRGVIVPAARGALAVLTRDGAGSDVDTATLDAVATQVAAVVRYVERDGG